MLPCYKLPVRDNAVILQLWVIKMNHKGEMILVANILFLWKLH